LSFFACTNAITECVSCSVALDSASRQVDEMIDQARYRHQHHRSKFKEAIDYLDQVFEDLKKECDTPVHSFKLLKALCIFFLFISRKPKKGGSMKSGDVSRPSRPNPTKSKPINALPQKVTPKTTFQSPPANMSAAMAEAKTRIRKQPEASLSNPSSPGLISCLEAWKSVGNEDQLNGGQCDLERVSSHNQIPERKRSGEVPSWRSTSQEAFNTLASVRSEENGVTRRSGAFAQYNPSTSVSTGGSVNSLPDAGLIMSSQPARQPDPILAIDALVAELELNTDEANVTEKRRSFPTRLETLSNRFPECEQSRSSRQRTNGDKIAKTSWTDRGARRVQQQKMAFDEMTSMLRSVAGDINSNGQPGLRKQIPPAPGTVLSPFETINQEKLNPSKVEAIQLMFESKQGVPPTWRRNVLRGRRTSGEEDTYYEINEFSKNRKEQSPPYSRPLVKPQSPVVRGAFVALSQPQKRNPSHATAVHVQPAQQDFVPALPVTQPPSHPPGNFGNRTCIVIVCEYISVSSGSANSSQAGGYYSSGSSLGAPSSYTPSHHQSSLPRSSTSGRRGSLIGKQSTSSRPASFEDEDDGFYDNIQINEHRFSRSSEADNASVNSHRLPPSSKAGGEGGTRFGHFLRRIGSSKPPAAAASLMSLNKVASENVSGHAPLMKSNSLSDEPWKTQVIAKAHATTRRGKLITLISFDPLICQRPA
uniref:TPR_REGION domain-containing protein n=1 Tax=Toxocara canis TaxID=6265 RepID=A0A183V259_TOXCA